MSCAIWTLLGIWVLLYNPNAKSQLIAYFSLAGISLVFALLQTIYRLHVELESLKALPPDIKLIVHDVVMHRTGDEEWKWRFGHFLVQVSAELQNMPEATIEYAAQLIYRGEVIQLQPIKDVEQWEIIERKYYEHLGSRSRESFITTPSPIAENLTRSVKQEGWLHFQIDGMPESEIAKRTLRLYATSSNGAVHVDEELAKHHVVRSELVAMKKPRTTSVDS
jgi:hypothetical protein